MFVEHIFTSLLRNTVVHFSSTISNVHIYRNIVQYKNGSLHLIHWPFELSLISHMFEILRLHVVPKYEETYWRPIMG